MQPLAQQVRRLTSALKLLGQPFDKETLAAIDQAIAQPNEREGVSMLEKTLDRDVLAIVDINAESRVKVERGAAEAELVEGGTRLFLVKVMNRAAITSPLSVESPNSGRVYVTSDGDPAPAMTLTQTDVRDRWADISLADSPPLDKRLSGFHWSIRS